ncbi:MAG: hypothetical protein HYW25_02695 [Candidatus Aenigmarchaeota archaeon]|nr:hypothetical protein [Candidatus Aenigmarchaeota archaeon]
MTGSSETLEGRRRWTDRPPLIIPYMRRNSITPEEIKEMSGTDDLQFTLRLVGPDDDIKMGFDVEDGSFTINYAAPEARRYIQEAARVEVSLGVPPPSYESLIIAADVLQKPVDVIGRHRSQRSRR